jgi:hypothetical protein
MLTMVNVITCRTFLKLVNTILDAEKRKVTINLEGDKHTYDFFRF